MAPRPRIWREESAVRALNWLCARARMQAKLQPRVLVARDPSASGKAPVGRQSGGEATLTAVHWQRPTMKRATLLPRVERETNCGQKFGSSGPCEKGPGGGAGEVAKETQLGVQQPLGLWDPLDLRADEATFNDYRPKEIKHGRLAMMAALKMLAQGAVQVPGMVGVPRAVIACLVGNVQNGFLAILAVIAVLEAAVFLQGDNNEPGNFGSPSSCSDGYSTEMRSREFNNGRIAIVSAIGIIAAGWYTGKPAIDQVSLRKCPTAHDSLHHAVPLRSCDPDVRPVSSIKRRRVTEKSSDVKGTSPGMIVPSLCSKMLRRKGHQGPVQEPRAAAYSGQLLSDMHEHQNFCRPPRVSFKLTPEVRCYEPHTGSIMRSPRDFVGAFRCSGSNSLDGVDWCSLLEFLEHL